MKTIILFFILSLLFADSIVLKNGKILDGYLVSRDLEYITFKSKGTSHVIKTSEIALADFNKNYTRIEDNHLQVKIVTLEKEGKRFTLCSMVHVGDKRFYRKIESILDKNDLVLYEAFGIPYNKDFSTWEIPEKKYYAHPERYEDYGNYFHFVAKILGLTLQIEELQTDKPFWEPSDLSHEQFSFYLKKRQLQDLWQNITEEIDPEDIRKEQEINNLFELAVTYPYNKNLKKYVLNRFARDIVSGENSKLSTYLKVVLIDRNNQILQDIYECLLNKDLKSIGVSYGAYHSKGIIDSMMSNGFVFVEEFWTNAWDLK